MIDKTADDAAVLGVVGFEPDAWPALMLFLDCQTQWRTGPGGLIGMDYGAVAWVFRLRSVTDEAAMLSDLQIIEAEILQALGEQQK